MAQSEHDACLVRVDAGEREPVTLREAQNVRWRASGPPILQGLARAPTTSHALAYNLWRPGGVGRQQRPEGPERAGGMWRCGGV